MKIATLGIMTQCSLAPALQGHIVQFFSWPRQRQPDPGPSGSDHAHQCDVRLVYRYHTPH